MPIYPVAVYCPPNDGSNPNLVWYSRSDPDIARKIIVDHVLDTSPPKNIWLSTVHAESDADKVHWSGFERWICYIGEPHADFGKWWPKLDRPNVDIVMTGAANFFPEHARIWRTETFFGESYKLYRRFPQDLDNDHFSKVKPLYFDALLGTKSRLPRAFIHDHLLQTHADKNIVRVYGHHHPYHFSHVSQDEYILPEGMSLKPEQMHRNFFAAAMVDYRGVETMICMIVPMNVYEQTAYSIVAETYVTNEFNFYTEKTAKPILGRRLFVAFAGQYHLRNLRRLGFQTFHGIIDETYDTVEDPEQRWAMAMDQVDCLIAQDQAPILEKIRPIVEHNFSVMMGRDWAEAANAMIIERILAN